MLGVLIFVIPPWIVMYLNGLYEILEEVTILIFGIWAFQLF